MNIQVIQYTRPAGSHVCVIKFNDRKLYKIINTTCNVLSNTTLILTKRPWNKEKKKTSWNHLINLSSWRQN